MLKISRLAALAILGVIAASPVYAENKAAAVVNGASIPQERVDLRVKMVTSQGQPDSPELRKAIRDDLINVEVLSQEAAKKNLDKQPETVQLLELSRQQVLAGAYMQDYIKTHPISDEEIAKEYDNLKARHGDKEYKVSHILVDTQDEAKAIEAQLKKKGKFDKIAKEKSKDAGSGAKGGELGWNTPSNFVKPFGEAVIGLSKGQVSEPVQSQFGWHIIKLEDVRDSKIPSLDEIKPQLTQHLQQQTVKQLITELRDKAKIE